MDRLQAILNARVKEEGGDPKYAFDWFYEALRHEADWVDKVLWVDLLDEELRTCTLCGEVSTNLMWPGDPTYCSNPACLEVRDELCMTHATNVAHANSGPRQARAFAHLILKEILATHSPVARWGGGSLHAVPLKDRLSVATTAAVEHARRKLNQDIKSLTKEIKEIENGK